MGHPQLPPQSRQTHNKHTYHHTLPAACIQVVLHSFFVCTSPAAMPSTKRPRGGTVDTDVEPHAKPAPKKAAKHADPLVCPKEMAPQGEMEISAAFDGASRGNPGPGGAAAVVWAGSSSQLQGVIAAPLRPKTTPGAPPITCNLAEALGALCALQGARCLLNSWAKAGRWAPGTPVTLRLFGDSALLVDFMRRKKTPREATLVTFLTVVHEAVKKLPSDVHVQWAHLPRRFNKAADACANMATDSKADPHVCDFVLPQGNTTQWLPWKPMHPWVGATVKGAPPPSVVSMLAQQRTPVVPQGSVGVVQNGTTGPSPGVPAAAPTHTVSSMPGGKRGLVQSGARSAAVLHSGAVMTAVQFLERVVDRGSWWARSHAAHEADKALFLRKKTASAAV